MSETLHTLTRGDGNNWTLYNGPAYSDLAVDTYQLQKAKDAINRADEIIGETGEWSQMTPTEYRRNSIKT